MFLASTSDELRLVTDSAVSSISVQASWVDNAVGVYTPGRTNTAITTATTTTIVGSPAASTVRNVRGICISNTSTSNCVVTVQHYDGTTAIDIEKLTLLPSETLLRDERGDWRHQTAYGCEYEAAGTQTPSNWGLGIAGTLAETYPRQICQEISAGFPTSGTLRLHPVFLKAGQIVSSISFFSSTTAAVTPTNQRFALYSRRLNLLAQSADDTTTAWAANTIKTLAMTTPYTAQTSDLYYIALLVVAGTTPSFKGVSSGTAGLRNFTPSLAGNGDSGLTTTLPDPCTSFNSSIGSNILIWAAIT